MEVTYEEFINNILETRGRFACGDEYHERHHIVPKCMGGMNDEENLIDLFAREHFEAHRLLALENPNVQGLIYAWWAMSIQTNQYTKERYRITPEEYEEIKKKYSETLSKNNIGENNPFYGKHHSEESKKKMSENHADFKGKNSSRYGKHHTEESKRKMSESQKGKYAGENNPMYGVRITGEFHWNYGKHLSDDTKNKIRESLKGNYPSKETRKKMSEAQKERKDNKKPVVCVETQILYNSVTDASIKTVTNINGIVGCCKERRKTAGGYQWNYLYDQNQKDGTTIPGAITLGLITEEEALRMLKEQKETEGESIDEIR